VAGGPRTLAAQAWADLAEPIDRQLSPLGLAAIEALAPRAGEAILDVGCGAGQTVLQLAERVGPGGRVVGVDIAPALLALGRARAAGLAQASFVEADAARLELEPGGFDGLFSRFGVMGFADPVAAFAGFRRLLKPAGRLAFVCWRALAENELDALALSAAGLEDRLDATPFSFADPEVIRATLEAAGFAEIAIRPDDQAVSCGGLEATLAVLTKVGALGRILRENPELRGAAEPRVRAALSTRGQDDRVTLGAATWIVTARA